VGSDPTEDLVLMWDLTHKERKMELDEIIISRAILETFTKDFIDHLENDVAIVGAGPAGLIAAYYLAKKKTKVVVFEKSLRVGGGMPGGGMMMNLIVFQEEAKEILDELGAKTKEYKKGYFTADSLEVTGLLAAKSIQAGAKIFNLIKAEDVVIRENKVSGLVLNWSSVEAANLSVDPLAIRCKIVIDATGHNSEVTRIVENKIGPRLNTKTGKILGEKPMWAEVGERTILKNTKEVCPNLYVAGMAANAVFGGPRMGPIFGGMLLSGKKVAEQVGEKIGRNQ